MHGSKILAACLLGLTLFLLYHFLSYHEQVTALQNY